MRHKATAVLYTNFNAMYCTVKPLWELNDDNDNNDNNDDDNDNDNDSNNNNDNDKK